MDFIFEAKYLAIKWKDENTVLNITESQSSIPIDTDGYGYRIELQTYTRIENGLDGQIAFRLLDNSDIEPYIEDASNNRIALLKVKDPKSNEVWWVENGKWKKNGKYRESPLWNHVGEAKIIFGDTVCYIDIRANSFTKDQLERYLEDFRNDFWSLILKPDSFTKGSAKSNSIKLLNDDNLKVFDKFIEYAQKLLKNPKKELREVQSLRDIKKVRPVARTFMEIATSGFKKQLTSRDTIESYNVPENRYVLYAIWQVYNIVTYISKASGHIEKIYNNRANYEEQRLKNFKNNVEIDKEIFENEILHIKEKMDEERKLLYESISKQNESIKKNCEEEAKTQQRIDQAISYQGNIPNIDQQPQKFVIRLESRQNDYNNKIQFWGKIRSIDSNLWDDFGQNDWFSLKFDENFSFLLENCEYEIDTYTIYNKRKNQKGTIHEIFFYYIKAFKLLTDVKVKTIIIKTAAMKLFQNRIQFKGSAKFPTMKWISLPENNFYSFEFRNDIFGNVIKPYQIYEILAYIRSSKQTWEKNNKQGIVHKRYFEYIQNIKLVESSFEKELKDLESQKPNLEATNWQRELTFKEKQEQENEKQALLKSIKKLKQYEETSHNLLKQIKTTKSKLDKLQKEFINLKINKDSYFPNSMTFVQNPNYQGVYRNFLNIKNIAGIDENLFIQMQIIENIGLVDIPTLYERWCLLQIIKVLIDKYNFIPETNWKMKLSNQMIEDVNKIRDVEIKFTNTNIGREIVLRYEDTLKNRKRPDFILDIISNKTGKDHRLIMDAKFHEKVDIRKQIDLLYKGKNYSEDGKNSVFVLHPDVNKSIKNIRTPSKWGNDAFYGEIDLFNFDWDKDEYPNHKYGAILVSPFNKNGEYLDNLQRLIGLNMQYSLEGNVNKTDPIPQERVFCILCGSNNCNISEPIRASARYPDRWQYKVQCMEEGCGHFFIYNYCWNCKQRLIKNGRYWSYHSFQILNPFDIRCPHCSKLLSELPRGN